MEMSKPIAVSTGMVQDLHYWLVLCMVKNMMKEHFKALLFSTLMVSILDIKLQLIISMHQGVYPDMVSIILIKYLLLLALKSLSTTMIS